MAPSWASTAHVGLAATAVRPTRHSDHLAEIHSLFRGTDCGLPSDRIPYSRTSSALVALLSTDKCDHQRPMCVCTIRHITPDTLLLREMVHAAEPQRTAGCGVVYDRTRPCRRLQACLSSHNL